MTDSRSVHVQNAQALEEDAALCDDPCSELVQAAENWHLADEHERERDAVTRAFKLDVDAGPLSGKGAYIAYLLTHGRTDEAAPLLDELRRTPSKVAMTYMDVHYGFAASGDVAEGMRWLNAGANHIVPSLDEPLEATDQGFDLLMERWHARRDQGMPADAMDEFVQRCAAHHEEVSEGIHRLTDEEGDLDGLVDEEGNLSLTLYPVPLWTAEEFARSVAEHPEWWNEGTTHEDYRRSVQRELADVPTGACLVPTTVTAVEEFAASFGIDPADPEAPDDFVFEEAHDGRYLPWPPGRNDTCWCGSGRKYKKCCGAPGFA
ncbi:SEC-C domain-containing protein [Saccharopolyspora sp. TS4A08]|uniref:SEC-C domain-containing protein n=1 Tax=Saccharopolyspora ipomoeae TaxID=3042027 RepID=A0ABT6PUF1_9PSEU|nr:SEC-C domain-containing protein [Saccharopolyspora sp. TS4A08]MDI2031634.1 SEC-C domain-containing protein [Saccharopolyspora sp. TS4A08]